MVQFNYCRLVPEVGEANVDVFQHSVNLKGWEMGDAVFDGVMTNIRR